MMTRSYPCSAMRRALYVLLFAATAAYAHPPVGIVVDRGGNVYYSDLKQVWRLAPGGKKTVVVPRVHTHELYLDAGGNLYGEHLWYEGEAINRWDYYVWRRSPDGRVQTVYGPKREVRSDYSFVRDAAGNHYWGDGERPGGALRPWGGEAGRAGRPRQRDREVAPAVVDRRWDVCAEWGSVVAGVVGGQRGAGAEGAVINGPGGALCALLLRGRSWRQRDVECGGHAAALTAAAWPPHSR